MKIKNKNVFISSSCIVPNDYSRFSQEERFAQLVKTLESCDEVPDHVNVISEGSNISDAERKVLGEKSIVITYENDYLVKELTKYKQLGTIILWMRALQSIEVKDDSNIFYVSGRYLLLDGFDVKSFDGDYVFKQPWFSEERGGWYGLQLFKLKGSKREEFIKVLETSLVFLLVGKAADVECAVYQAIQAHGITPSLVKKVYCGGNVGLNGNFEIH